MAPFFGSTLVSWTILIGVLMLFLSIGNWVGGYYADKNPSITKVSTVLILEAIALCWVWLMKDPLLKPISKSFLNPEFKLILSTTLLFGPISTLSGMFTPLVIRVNTTSSNEIGKISGKIYALSTIGGIMGTFCTGLWLLPAIGIKHTIIIGSITLLASAIPGLVKNWKLYLVAISAITLGAFKAQGEVHQTLYGQVEIIEQDSIRYLKINNYISAAEHLHSDSLIYKYTRFFQEVGASHPNPRRALMIGGSICSVPRQMVNKHSKLQFDIIEPDKHLIDFAIKDFSLERHERLQFYYDDGRHYIQYTEQQYDLIYIDAFTSKTNIPFQLCTKEAVNSYSDHLQDQGVLAFNIVCSEASPAFLNHIQATYKTAFKHVHIYDLMPDEHLKSKSWVLIASNNPTTAYKKPTYTSTATAIVFTDDWAPIEQLLE